MMPHHSAKPSQLPPPLQPLVSLLRTSSSPPAHPLLLLTSLLTHPTPFLLVRLLCSYLSPPSSFPRHDVQEGREYPPVTNIVFVSWLRDLPFWAREAKALGVDLEKHRRASRFTYLDFLSSPPPSHANVESTLHKALEAAAQQEKGKGGKKTRVVLILDGLDLHLAMHTASQAGLEVVALLQALRSRADLTILSLSADAPFMPPSRSTPREERETELAVNHQILLLHTAHQADVVVGLRGLDTGGARDVTGVLRITLGPEDDVHDDGDGSAQEEVEEGEWCYYLDTGGAGMRGEGAGLKVFKRGESR